MPSIPGFGIIKLASLRLANPTVSFDSHSGTDDLAPQVPDSILLLIRVSALELHNPLTRFAQAVLPLVPLVLITGITIWSSGETLMAWNIPAFFPCRM